MKPLFLPDPTQVERPWRKWIWLGGAMAAFALLVLARPVYRELKEWRADRLAVGVEDLREQGRLREAIDLAQAGLQLSPSHEPLLRETARILSDAGSADAFAFYERLGELEPLEKEDHVKVISLGLALRRLDRVEQFLQEALRRWPEDAALLKLAAVYADKRSDRARAAMFAEEALRRAPGDKELELFLARQWLSSADFETFDRGVEGLILIAETDFDRELEALRLLGTAASRLAPSVAERVHRSMAGHPGLQDSDEFMLADLRLRFEPEKEMAIADSLVKRFRLGNPLGTLQLARWLNKRGRHERTLAVISETLANSNRDFLLVRLDALAATGQWKAVADGLERTDLPLDEAVAEIYRARAAEELGNPAMADLHWKQAQTRAADKPEALVYLGSYASKIGRHDEADEAYQRLGRLEGYERAALELRVGLADRRGDTAQLRRLLADLIKVAPNSTAARNDKAYLDLLAGENINEAARAAEELVLAAPEFMSHRVTLALARLRQGRGEEALKVFEESDWDRDKALPGWQAVYVAALQANGRNEEARELAARLPLGAIKEEERELIDGAAGADGNP